jgi:toxin-antitoxin system PIN domain toxin
MTYLPDVNFWLALAFESHVHHSSATQWFEALATENCSFCRLTQQGFLRLATNPKAFGEEAVTLADAWRLYDAILSDTRVSYADEPSGLDSLWRVLTAAQTFSPKVWNDSYLAAFAQQINFELVTFDRAFKQYQNLRCKILT